jgi:hypothetical protein
VLTAESAQTATQVATLLNGLKAWATLNPDPAIDAIGRAVVASGAASAEGERVRISASIPFAAVREQMAHAARADR